MRLSGSLLGVSRRRVAGGLRADTAAFITRMSVAPDATHRNALDQFFSATAPIRPKLDCLYLLASHDAQAARLNLIGSGFALSEVSAPTFTVDRGYQGNGTSSYLNSGFIPATAGGKFTQDGATLFHWPLTDLLNGAAESGDIGAGGATINRRSPSGIRYRANTSASITAGTTFYPGLVAWSRSGSASRELFFNGASASVGVEASAATSTGPIYVCAVNGGIVGVNQEAVAGWGAALSASEHAVLYAASRGYLQALGAVA